MSVGLTRFRDVEMLEFRIGRLVTRWHLGERLAKAAQGGRGRPKMFSQEKIYTQTLEKIGLATRQAQEAQRIACLPPPELEGFCARAGLRNAGKIPA